MTFKLTVSGQNKILLKKGWHYLQRFIQYGYLITVSVMFVYHKIIPVCSDNPYSNSCHYIYISYSIEEILGYTSLGLLIIYWHKNTKKI